MARDMSRGKLAGFELCVLFNREFAGRGALGRHIRRSIAVDRSLPASVTMAVRFPLVDCPNNHNLRLLDPLRDSR